MGPFIPPYTEAGLGPFPDLDHQVPLRAPVRVKKHDVHKGTERLDPGQAQKVPVLEEGKGIVSSLGVGGGENCL